MKPTSKGVYAIVIFCLLMMFKIQAQPQGISYQAVARDSAGNLLANQTVTMRFSIRDALPGGSIIYSETHAAVTSELGLFTCIVGQGSVVMGDFSSISWGSSAKYLQVEMDASGGFVFSDMGTQQLMSVPYALHAGNLPQGTTFGQTLFWNGTSWVSTGNLYNNGTSIGIGNAPDTSAALDISSTDKGLLLPRLTTAQRDAIVQPAPGLIIYNTESNCLEMRIPGAWKSFCEGICTPMPTTANAGDDITQNTIPVQLNANVPVSGTGVWTVVSGTGGSFADSSDAQTIFTCDFGDYILRWSISTPCSTSTDEISVHTGCPPGLEDCNGNAADGCESDLSMDPDNCGVCGNVCANAYANAVTACNAGICFFVECLPGFYDLDGNLANGCEYACNFISSTDDPDESFIDANCDGIDGMINSAIFVSPSGSDASPGTRALPKQTINAGINAAQSTGKSQVYISSGNYSGVVTLLNGISLYGGYSSAANWARSASFIATISSSTPVSGRIFGIQGSGINLQTVVDRLTVTTGNNPTLGGSNYGVYCNTCPGLRFTNNVVSAGSGGNGSSGAAVGSGMAGSIGGNGSPGACDSDGPGGSGGTAGSSPCFMTGGVGGKGGATPDQDGQSGGTGGGGTTGGVGGPTGNPGVAGGNGNPGANGTNGSHGLGGSGGAVVSGFWLGIPGGAGLIGGNGHGGGGGGGGGSQSGPFFINDGQGNGGGGGGGGGCGGLGGNGGTAGGGSFGLFLVNSTGCVVSGNQISSSTGGNGGAGSNGGLGGSGAFGGVGATVCLEEVGRGGNGGKGGNGGNGGHGGGGAGGASYAVYRSVTTVNLAGNILLFGAGGAGGPSSGNSGSAGASGGSF